MRNFWNSGVTADELREHMAVSMERLERACDIRTSADQKYRNAKRDLDLAEYDVKFYSDQYDQQKEALDKLEGLQDLCECDLASLLKGSQQR